jgi:hypothetical protein
MPLGRDRRERKKKPEEINPNNIQPIKVKGIPMNSIIVPDMNINGAETKKINVGSKL